jgi:hypothetical protein
MSGHGRSLAFGIKPQQHRVEAVFGALPIEAKAAEAEGGGGDGILAAIDKCRA